MKIGSILPLVLLCSYCFASDELNKRATTTCSLGIARQFNTVSWDLTVYNVAQPFRQDNNVIGTLRNTPMALGQNMTLKAGSLSTLTVMNLDNAVVFDYGSAELNASIVSLDTGKTKVRLGFELDGASWTTDNCTAGSVVISAGRESWSCDFSCAVGGKREL